VFQNRLLVEDLAGLFAERRQPLGLPGAIPPGDGGLAAGQLAVALARVVGAE
jgi:hydrogenase maturation protein HypF